MSVICSSPTFPFRREKVFSPKKELYFGTWTSFGSWVNLIICQYICEKPERKPGFRLRSFAYLSAYLHTLIPTWLFACLTVQLSVCLSRYLADWLSVCFSVPLSLFFFVSVWLSASLSAYLSVWLMGLLTFSLHCQLFPGVVEYWNSRCTPPIFRYSSSQGERRCVRGTLCTATI